MNAVSAFIKPAGIASAGILLSACAGFGAPVEEGPTPEQRRLTALEQRLDLLEQKFENFEQLATSSGGSDEQVRELRGEIERLNFELTEAKRRERQLYLDVDKRLQALEQGGVTTGTGTGGDVPTNESPESEAAYLAAFDQLKAGNFDQSITDFNQFLGNYPQSGYADNAQYWVGEAHYVKRAFDPAVKAFNTLLEKYPSSPKVPDALLKLGYIQYEQKKFGDARKTLERITSDYAESSVARLAEQRLARMKQEGR
ncbi:tol-pal system protein YbgF [bacterium]|nr:tol-pal system protein YbgF [bacterium]